MNQAQIRFHAELNDFLPRDNRQNSIVCAFEGKPSVKHLIETLGIPHTEVYRILVNDNPVNFAYHVQDGDHIRVYPVSVKFDVSEEAIQSQPAGERRYDLFPAITPFRRCMRCNGILQETRKEEVLHRLEPLTELYFEEFRVCSACDRVYWRGSHFERMQQFIEQLFTWHPLL